MNRLARVRELVDVYNRGDLEPALELMHPEVVWLPAPEDPDASPRVRREEVRWHFQQWLDAFPGLQFEIEELREEGDDAVVLLHYWGHGAASGARVDDRVWQRLSFRGELIVRVDEWYERPGRNEGAGPG